MVNPRQNSLIPGRHRTRPNIWGGAVLLALLLHLGAIVGARALRLFAPSSTQQPGPDVIEVVFEPLPEQRQPRQFSELPPERADEAPERPEFLSNVDSRARDLVPGGNTDLPRLDGSSEAPHIAMVPASGAQTSRQDDSRTPTSESPNEEVLLRNDLLREQVATSTRSPQLDLGGGSSDILQEAMSYPKGNAPLPGDISLSTTEWDFAPWLLTFRRAVNERWHPPSAYFVGLIHGWSRVQVVVTPDGQLQSVRVLDEDVGHESLTSAAVLALQYAAPFRSLPKDFPDETLILTIKFFYPNLKTSPARPLGSAQSDPSPRPAQRGARP